jgi:hypothetical protein
MELTMADTDGTRSTFILFIAILIAVLITVWIILSFDRPNDPNMDRQTGFYTPMQIGYPNMLNNIDLENFS